MLWRRFSQDDKINLHIAEGASTGIRYANALHSDTLIIFIGENYLERVSF